MSDAPNLLMRLRNGAIALGVVLLVLLCLVTVSWNAVFHYVEPGEMAVVISKTGDDPPAGQLLAKPGQKGPLERTLGPGRHFVLPYYYEVEVEQLEELNMVIPPEMIGVVTAKVGEDLAPGQILAEPGQKGIQREVLPPGWHRLNPYGYEVELVPATIIRPGFVGFVTSLVGTEQTEVFAGEGGKGILAAVLQPGIYYLNPHAYRVREVEVGLNQVSFLDGDQIRFPSKDAFDIQLDATVEWELRPDNVAPVMAEFGAREEIEQKVLIAQARSIGRLEGSKYGAKEFLLGEGRRQIQDAFTAKLEDKVHEKHVEIHSAYIRHITIPDNLLEPIRESFVAKEKELTAAVQEETRRSAAALQRERSLIEQRKKEVHAETGALVNRIDADTGRQVAEIEAETRRLVAEKQQEIARLEARATKLLGEARANVERLLGEARAGLFELKVGAFGGDSQAFARYTFANELPEGLEIRLVQSGEGTFWTDLDQTAGGPLMGNLVEGEEQARRARSGE